MGGDSSVDDEESPFAFFIEIHRNTMYLMIRLHKMESTSQGECV
jgi:hypothetical protein